MRVILLVLLSAAMGTAAGCDSDTQQDSPAGLRSAEGLLIRDWLQALERSDYRRAAMFFAPGALIDQGEPFRLRNEAAARIFNATLPCRADLVALEEEGDQALASFRLRAGPGGPCKGVVKVRFRFRDERFSEFLQLPGPDDGPGREFRPGETV